MKGNDICDSDDFHQWKGQKEVCDYAPGVVKEKKGKMAFCFATQVN
jgi:hypothetical protein